MPFSKSDKLSITATKDFIAARLMFLNTSYNVGTRYLELVTNNSFDTDFKFCLTERRAAILLAASNLLQKLKMDSFDTLENAKKAIRAILENAFDVNNSISRHHAKAHYSGDITGKCAAGLSKTWCQSRVSKLLQECYALVRPEVEEAAAARAATATPLLAAAASRRGTLEMDRKGTDATSLHEEI